MTLCMRMQVLRALPLEEVYAASSHVFCSICKEAVKPILDLLL